MEPRKHRTPSGLPPANFEEGADVWDFVQKSENELDLILEHGVWAPEQKRREQRRAVRRKADRARTERTLFAANSTRCSSLGLLYWWEARRAAYNCVLLGVAAFGLCALWMVAFAFRYKMQGLNDAFASGDALLDVHALFWLALTVNAVFTLGCVTDIVWSLRGSRVRDPGQSASLVRTALWISFACLSLMGISLLHFAIAH